MSGSVRIDKVKTLTMVVNV